MIRVRTAGQHTLVMSVRDNGVGMPPKSNLQRVNTLGLKLVQRLTRQLNGTISISRKDGTEVRVRFALQNANRPALA